VARCFASTRIKRSSTPAVASNSSAPTPGLYVPRALQLRCQAPRQPLQHVAEEMLALTKMNWNNTQFDNGLPIAIAAARHVGEVLKYVPEGQEIAPRYSFYM
jgi:hypothetical protein